MHLVGAVAQLASENNHFTDDQLGNTAGVTEGRVEDGNTLIGSILEIDLVGTDTEATDDDEVLGLLQDASSELSL